MIFPSATGGNGPDYIQWISQEAPITAQTYLYPDTPSHRPAPQLNIQILTWALRHYAFKYIAWPVCLIKDQFKAPLSFGYWKLLNSIFMGQNGGFESIKISWFCRFLFLTACEESSQCHSVKAPLGQNKQVVSYWVVYGRVLHVLRPLLVLLIPNWTKLLQNTLNLHSSRMFITPLTQ